MHGYEHIQATYGRPRCFVEALAAARVPPDVTNQYAYDDGTNAIRRENLLLYFEQMALLGPRVLLVGEAPGYRGCRLTGVPFTSEAIVAGGVPGMVLFGRERGYRTVGGAGRLCREQTATIVWGTLARMPVLPLLWNAFPFHPHEPENERSNRRPNAFELKLGAGFLLEIIRLFEVESVVAVGKTAERTLLNMSIACRKVRHPANGGKGAFVAGMRET